MNELSLQMKSVLRVISYFSLLCVLVWLFADTARPYAAGFILGMAVGAFNAYLLGKRIHLWTKRILEGSRKRVSLGFIARVCSALIAAMICVKLPQFDLVSMIIGLFFTQLVILLMGFLSALKRSL